MPCIDGINCPTFSEGLTREQSSATKFTCSIPPLSIPASTGDPVELQPIGDVKTQRKPLVSRAVA